MYMGRPASRGVRVYLPATFAGDGSFLGIVRQLEVAVRAKVESGLLVNKLGFLLSQANNNACIHLPYFTPSLFSTKY